MTHDRAVILSALLGVLLCLASAWMLIPQIQRERENLELDIAVPEDLPPEIALATVLLGSFRGILVDILWERHNVLQREEKFYEAVQLARMITSLQPKFPRVWSFMAWNMSYNISIATHTPEERWAWVQAGIRLLRDQGIAVNPRSMKLHRELAWIILHKISALSDNFHDYYQQSFAREWDLLLGTPPEETAVRIAWFERIALAPTTEAELLSLDAELVPHVERLHEELGLILDGALLFRVRVSAPDDPVRGWFGGLSGAQRARIDDYVRSVVVREKFRMDPLLMLDLMRHIGPLDWRHSASHGIYWIAQGVLRSETHQTRVRLERGRRSRSGEIIDDLDLIYPYPNMTGALRHQWEEGRVRYDRHRERYVFSPDLRFLQSFVNSLVHEPYLRELLERNTYLAFFRGDEPMAEELLRNLRKFFATDANRGYLYKGSVEDFVESFLATSKENAAVLEKQVVTMFYSAFLIGLAEDRREIYERLHLHARKLYDSYRPSPGETLRSFDELTLQALVEYFSREPNVASVDGKVRTWALLPDGLRRKTAARSALMEQLRDEAVRDQRNPDLAFPMPPAGRD